MTTRTATLVLTAAAAVLQALTIGPKAAPRFVWNASESVPTGLYGVHPARRLIVTDLVVAFPPEQLATVLADGGYLPRGLPLIKRVLALPGQIVCRKDLTIIVDGIEIGTARERDSRGRLLLAWQGCRALRQGEVFLMNWDEPASLDSRYFGPLPIAAIIGRAIPLWTFEEK
jgi:conjugative transfer signal peptidase TraF